MTSQTIPRYFTPELFSASANSPSFFRHPTAAKIKSALRAISRHRSAAYLQIVSNHMNTPLYYAVPPPFQANSGCLTRSISPAGREAAASGVWPLRLSTAVKSSRCACLIRDALPFNWASEIRPSECCHNRRMSTPSFAIGSRSRGAHG